MWGGRGASSKKNKYTRTLELIQKEGERIEEVVDRTGSGFDVVGMGGWQGLGGRRGVRERREGKGGRVEERGLGAKSGEKKREESHPGSILIPSSFYTLAFSLAAARFSLCRSAQSDMGRTS